MTWVILAGVFAWMLACHFQEFHAGERYADPDWLANNREFSDKAAANNP